ncbi:MAG: hypothetical protein HWN66_06145 [Candidatus Helarchaeota archaeon]|nr:hypothetical protein [Candidatus Helarchaeota archaeon]
MSPRKVRKIDLNDLYSGKFDDIDDGTDEHKRLRRIFNPYLKKMYEKDNPLQAMTNYFAEIFSPITLIDKESSIISSWPHRPDESIKEKNGTYTFIEFHTASTNAIEKKIKWEGCIKKNNLYFGKPSHKHLRDYEVKVKKIIFVVNTGQYQKIKGQLRAFQSELFEIELYHIDSHDLIQKIM